MLKIRYDTDEQIIYLSDGEREWVLESEMPSEPVFSPDKTLVAYISPLEWECLGSLFIVNLLTGEKKALIEPDEFQNIPKQVIWIDERTLGVIIGFGHGTVQVGGNVFLYDLKTGLLNNITNHSDNTQITKIDLLDDETLLTEGIKYIDDQYHKYELFSNKVTINLYI